MIDMDYVRFIWTMKTEEQDDNVEEICNSVETIIAERWKVSRTDVEM